MTVAAVRTHLRRRVGPLLPVTGAVAVGFGVCGVIAWWVGLSPSLMFGELIKGAVEGPQLFETVARAVPLVGMALAAAIPLRGGMVNLGADGQLALGGCAAAIVALYFPAPDFVRLGVALTAGMVVGASYAALAAVGEIRAGVPLLLSTWLLTYPAKGLCGYLVRTSLRDPSMAWPSTARIAVGARLGHLLPGTPINQGFLLIAVLAIAVIFIDRRSSIGFELRLRGINERFARYGGVALNRQTLGMMIASGAIAGLVGAIMVLGSQFRYTDGALTAPQYSWSGTLAALLAGGDPVGSVIAAILFAALQTGGFAMERSVEIPRVLTMVLQSVVILFLAMRGAIWKRP
ncbi:MAG: ABC transporter permease [Pseudomonadota bacterium]|nr:ABC transporter permease [Pseudomonadota bacterium]